MQPYFFPYLGYFDLLHNVDLFVVYDTVQYIKQGWINRNRILHPNKSGWLYINVPVSRSSFENSYQTLIVDVKVSDSKPWKQHLLGQLAHYKKEALFYEQTILLVRECLDFPEIFLSQFNVNILARCAKLLGLNFQYQFISDLNVELGIERSAEERILDLCEFLGAKEYVNLPGGMGLYHPEAFAARNIKLTFRHLPNFIYSTGPYNFEQNLSIIDSLMWNSPEYIKAYLDEHRYEN